MNSARSATAAALGLIVVLAFAGAGIEARAERSAPPRPLPTAPLGQLNTGVGDFGVFESANPNRGLASIRAAGASAFRVVLSWRSTAPRGRRRPEGFRAADPNDPRYRWTAFDGELQRIVAHGLQPIVLLADAPAWAEGNVEGRAGTRRPDPTELGLFARAAALRYGGSFGALPRVRYWQIWNEPNLGIFLSPQIVGGRLVAGNWYRAMVNAAASAIHRVRQDNVVIAGGTAPFGEHGTWATPPREFIRQMLCMRGGQTPRAACRSRSAFDVWAHHPYTLGGPSHPTARPDDVSLPDLPALQRLFTSAWRARHIVARSRPPLWVTEFSWDTKPPDPRAVPLWVQARWVSEALYRMWRSRVSFVSWFQLRDDPRSKSSYQSGLYFYDGPAYKLSRPKPALTAFRFPFVALRNRGRVFVWGRTPDVRAKTVFIQQRLRGRWHRVRVLRANRYGIFSARLKVPLRGRFRAILAQGTASLGFALKPPPDMTLENPFGS